MYHSFAEFILEWKHEKDFTNKVFNNLTDLSLDNKMSEYGRSLGRLAWHIVTSIGEMGGTSGLKFQSAADLKVPLHAEEIKNAYKLAADNLEKAVSSQWSDDVLSDEVNMYGQMWKKAFVLEVLVKHQIHHRGQLTMLMRHSGLRVPGVYGPSYEEWQTMGMVPQE